MHCKYNHTKNKEQMLLQYKLLYKKGILKHSPFILKISSRFIFLRIFGWYFRFCWNSWYSFSVLLASLQQNHDSGFSSSPPRHLFMTNKVMLWFCETRYLKIGLSGWIDQVLSVRSIDFILFFLLQAHMCFVEVFTGATTFISAELAFTFGRG